MSKRAFIPDFYKQRKKICLAKPHANVANGQPNSKQSSPDSSTNVRAALELLHSLFPRDKFETKLPPIIMKHQLYSLVPNKTEVDRHLNDLRNRGDIRFFHLGAEEDDLSIMYADEYKTYVKSLNQNNSLIDLFLSSVLASCTDVGLNREFLAERFKIKDDEIAQLFRANLLTVRDVGSWWLSIPGAGEFMKHYLRGRKAILNTIRKAKYGEMLESELRNRQLRALKIGMEYHIHDIIGAELVECIETTSGKLLRGTE